MSSSPKISVLVAAYNVADFLPTCLDSILNQTFQDFEVIIVDDGSTDKTPSICQKYAEKSPKVKVIHQKNQGLSAVRNIGIQKSKGEYICFIDGDDYIAKKYLEKLFQQLSENSADISVCNYKTIPKSPVKDFEMQIISGEEATIKLLTEQENYQIVSWNKLYKKSLFKNIEFPLNQKHEDSLTTYKILSKAQKITFLNESLYIYRQRPGSIMSEVKLNERLNTKLTAAEEAKVYLQNHKKLFAAAQISELLAYLAFLDNIYAKKLSIKPFFALNWIENNQKSLTKNPYLTQKLKIYLKMLAKFNGHPYQIFRSIKH